MKSVALLLSLAFTLMFSLESIAQLETQPEEESRPAFRSKKHSLAFGALGGGEVRGAWWAMPSLGYKHYMEEGAIRVLVGGTVNNDFSGGGGWSSNYQEAGGSIRVGYQYHVLVGRFMPTLGVDIVGGYYESRNSWPNGSEQTTNIIAGVSPNLGLEFWITHKISILLDTRFDLGYKDYSYSYATDDPWGPGSSTTRTQGMFTRIAPVSSFMACFHF